MADGAYRSEIEAAHARIRQLEEELARYRGEPRARLVALKAQRALLVQHATPAPTRRELSVRNGFVLVFGTATACFAILTFWLWAILTASIAAAVHAFLARVARKRAERHQRELAAVDERIASLEHELRAEAGER